MTQISISDLRPFHVVKNYDSIDKDKIILKNEGGALICLII